MRHYVLFSVLILGCAGSPRARVRDPQHLAVYLASHREAIAAKQPQALAELDRLCGQHDCESSRLFWFTDLEAAKARARAENKPILSLHLLGKLTDPLSCANSRFFRSVLYPDPEVGRMLRERYVLHWKEVRPVPRVTIDFGDGRKLQRTLTGNSVHYVLDSDGQPIDALPGLIDPRAFAASLEHDLGLFASLQRAGERRDQVLAGWHRERLDAVMARWTKLLAEQRVTVPRAAVSRAADPLAQLANFDAMTRTIGYARLASPVSLAPEVQARIEARMPDAWRANEVAPTKAILESPVLGALREISTTLGSDSIENELWNHGRVHTWFVTNSAGQGSLEILNQRVYAELFKSPLDDPWYGLMPSEAMRALDDCAVRASH